MLGSSWSSRIFVILGTLLVPTGVLYAQAPQAFEAGVREVSWRFVAVGENGDPVEDLAADEIEVREDGESQEVVGLEYGASGLSVALLIDSSESMLYRMDDARSAARTFLSYLEPDDEVLGIDFDSRVRVLDGSFGDRKQLADSLAEVEADGATLLYDALAEAADRLSRRQGRRAIVLLSDGEDGSFDGGSRATFDEVVEKVRRAEIEVHTVGVGLAVNKFELRDLASETGGTHTFVEESAALSRIYRRIPHDLTEGYTVTYRSSHPGSDGAFRPVEIRVLRPGVSVRARSGYYAPGGEASSN